MGSRGSKFRSEALERIRYTDAECELFKNGFLMFIDPCRGAVFTLCLQHSWSLADARNTLVLTKLSDVHTRAEYVLHPAPHLCAFTHEFVYTGTQVNPPRPPTKDARISSPDWMKHCELRLRLDVDRQVSNSIASSSPSFSARNNTIVAKAVLYRAKKKKYLTEEELYYVICPSPPPLPRPPPPPAMKTSTIQTEDAEVAEKEAKPMPSASEAKSMSAAPAETLWNQNVLGDFSGCSQRGCSEPDPEKTVEDKARLGVRSQPLICLDPSPPPQRRTVPGNAPMFGCAVFDTQSL